MSHYLILDGHLSLGLDKGIIFYGQNYCILADCNMGSGNNKC